MSIDWSNAVASGVSGLLSFGGNLATSAINSSRAWKYTRMAMQYQDELNRAYYQWSSENGPSFSRKGYEQAGYNPLLALGSNLSGNSAIYSASGTNSDSDNGAQAVASAIDALRLRNENKMNKSQIKLNQSQEDLNTQATYKTFADELKSRAEANVSSATEAKILNDIRWDNVINDARLKEILANAQFQNERARGFSASSSQEKHGSLGGSFGKGQGEGKGKGSFLNFNASGNANYGQSKSESRSW